jgi:hypothetical protein
MVKETVYNEVARSRPGVSAATGIGFLLGDKKSTTSVQRWLFNSGQRTYQRKRSVWMCTACARNGGHGVLASIIGFFIIMAGLLFFFAAIIGILQAL